jgi:nitrogen fixation/metabolism regulation signal transduction histidine kinase
MGGRTILAAGTILFLLMLGSLLMMSDALQNSQRFGEYYSLLLAINAAGLALLIILIGVNLHGLLRQLRRRAPGIRLTLRMATMLVVLSVTPVLIVYYFSLTFLHRGIDNWFDLRIEQALGDSLELSRLALEQRMRENLRRTERIAESFAEISNAAVPFEIDQQRLRGGAEELTVMTRQGSFIASSVGDSANLVPDRPDETILFQVQQGNSYIGLDTIGSGLSIRAVVNVPQLGIEQESRIIQALFPFPDRINALAGSVESAFVQYRELSYLREKLKFSFILVLTLVLLFSMFSAVWAAFYSARRLTSPIRDLAEGTRAVADGDYNTQLSVPGNDELGFLVASFNEMTRRIAGARDAVRQSQAEAEAQRAYLEAVLGRLSSGVLVLDQERRIRTANISSGQILGVAVASLPQVSLDGMAERYPNLKPLVDLIGSRLEGGSGDWREQVALFGTSGRQILMCSGTSVKFSGAPDSTIHVIVFDEITALIQAQKNAAWSEMARRLAHEIKNPLTPIQLAAERLRQKYLPRLEAEQAGTMERLTNTIIQQVETMRDMVNTFSEYARPPAMAPEQVNLNDLLREVVDLFSGMDPDVDVILDLDPALPITRIDPGRIRQVLNNLLSNAYDAAAGRGGTVLRISSRHVRDAGPDFVEIRIRDSGPGVPEDIISSIFDPYVTTKQKGTGLGLAIVKKIIDEHNGLVWMENNRDSPGASAVIRLPGASDQPAAGRVESLRSRDAV